MPTIPITREVGVTLVLLKRTPPYALVKRWSSGSVYAVAHPNSGGTLTNITEATFQTLRQAKLIQKIDWDTHRWNWWRPWFGTRCWELSDAGKSLGLPPEEMWLEDE
jgi:hypothetical protein